MALPIIIAGAGLTIALLDRLSAFNESAEETAEKTESLITNAIIPLVALGAGGFLLYQVFREK
jgi:hypothetical protein